MNRAFPLTAARVAMLREAENGGADLGAPDYELIALWEAIEPYFGEVVDPHGCTRADLWAAYHPAGGS